MQDDAVEGYPLSAQQQRLWQLAGSGGHGVAAHRACVDIVADGELDLARLRAAVASVAARHEALRTVFTTVPHHRYPIQEVVAEATDLEVSTSEGHIRVELPAACADTQSLAVLATDLARCYGGADLAEPVQYAQFDAWQREVAEEAEAPWDTRLGDVLADAELAARPNRFGGPGARRAAEAGFRPAVIEIAAATTGLERLARERDVPVPSVLAAAWAVLLARRADTDEIAMGQVFHCRSFPELDDTVGLLARTLAVRVAVPGDAGIGELAGALHNSVSELADWQDGSAWPVEQHIVYLPWQFEYTRQPEPVSSRGVVFSVRRHLAHPEPFEVKLVATLAGKRLRLELWYDHGAVSTPDAERLAAALEALLADGTDLDTPVSRLAILGPAERRQVLEDWSAGEITEAPADAYHRLVEQAVDQTPDAVAVVAGDRRVTYAELDAAANRLANGLRARGVGPETRVGLRGDRSVDAVVGILGILKSGGVFVPLEFDHPDDVLANMCADACVELVLVGNGDAERITSLGHRPATFDEVAAHQPDTRPDVPLAPAALAYLVFTSGSTGRPKGVAVEHRNLVNYVTRMGPQLGLRPGWRYATVATTAVDLGYTALFCALATGGSLHLLDRDQLLDPAVFATFLAEHDIDCVKTTPSHLRSLLATRHVAQVFPKHLLVLGGEALAQGWLAEPAESRPAGCTIVNHYGPTETCIGVVAGAVSPPSGDGETEPETAPIGRPVGNATVYVLDEQLRPVPAGVTGELYVGGAAVSRGYAGRPDLTADRFVPDPYASAPGGRLYRTGDLAKWAPDGTVTCLGRTDDQTKIRGYRVEPLAVSAQLASHPAVAQAAVLPRTLPDGEVVLVGYVACEPDYAAGQGEELSAVQVGAWKHLFEGVYGEVTDNSTDNSTDAGDPTFELTGWNSSYTGEPMSTAEISESVDGIVSRVTSLPCDEVLEIGFGTGLLLFRLAAGRTRYWATELSAEALRMVRRGLRPGDPRHASVRLFEREAVDFAGFGERSFDLVLLNSVVQYFPSVDYLVEVLTKAVAAVRPGGNVFVGDVRDLNLAELFFTSVELHRAGDDMPLDELRRRVAATWDAENELLLDPAFFVALAAEVPGVTGVELQLKRGNLVNELTAFRYDVVLNVGQPAPAPVEHAEEVSWTPDLLTGRDRRPLLVRDVPDARTAADALAVRLLRRKDLATVTELRQAVAAAPAGTPPEYWWAREGETVAVQPARSGRPGHYDVLLGSASGDLATGYPAAAAHRPWSEFGNNPYRERLARALSDELRQHLKDRLPEYLVPTHLYLLDALPLASNGKLDTARLPLPLTRPAGTGAVTPPRTPVEEIVAGIWADVLGVEAVGVFDDFFDIGGHSLLAVQVVYRIREALGGQVTLRDFFAEPTVAALSVRVTESLLEAE